MLLPNLISTRNVLIGLFLTGVMATSAQRPSTYSYTPNSARYFTDAEMDSLIRRVSDSVFMEAGIPPALMEKKFQQLKVLITSTSRQEITRNFKMVETVIPPDNAVVGSAGFIKKKQAYTAALSKGLRYAMKHNSALALYLDFRGSDRIRSFNSTVRIQPNGKLLVEERIRVYNGDGRVNPLYANDASAEEPGDINDEIKRGIVRSFPLYYVNEAKLFQNTTFKVLGVYRDGKKEDYHTEKRDNGILLFTGTKERFLDNGTYEYLLIYETDHQIKLLKDFDELYWNATGNSWSFRIDSAQCTILLPPGVDAISNACYTGAQGEQFQNCNVTVSKAGDTTQIHFKTTVSLPPNTGLTVATSWKKGYVAGMSVWRKMGYYIWNNPAVFFFPIAAIFSAIFCFLFWWKYGRDPEKGTIYPQYDPPAGYSPAALGYIYYQKFKRQFTAATIVDAAVRQSIKIEVEKAGLLFKHNKYNIRSSEGKSKPPSTNYDDYYRHVKELVGTSIDKGKYNKDLADLNKTIEKDCVAKYKNKDGVLKSTYRGVFALNASYTILPVIVCVIAGIWSFFAGLMHSLTLLNFWQILYWVAGLILCIIVLTVFSRLLKAYSPEGRKLMDHIEGFRMFLSTADEQKFNVLAPPERTLDLYEKYLPFAIALGCEIEWGKQFESIINSAYLQGTVSATSFAYSLRNDSNSFSSSFTSSFSGAIASASTPPSSSSGGGSSFGGGSSGGGGGGGGGGGW